MKVVIFGATGFSGQAILKEAIQQGHEVTILVRDPSKIKIQHNSLTVVQGDVMNRNAVASVLHHQEVVIQCLGVGGKGNGKPNTFISDATKIIIEEMEKNKVRKLIAMSNVGAGNSMTFYPWVFSKVILPYFMKWLKVIIEDKNKMEPMIMNSNLNWTIVRCPNVIDKPPKGICHATLDGKGLKLSITLGDVASFMVNQIVDNTYSKQAPSISN